MAQNKITVKKRDAINCLKLPIDSSAESSYKIKLQMGLNIAALSESTFEMRYVIKLL